MDNKNNNSNSDIFLVIIIDHHWPFLPSITIIDDYWPTYIFPLSSWQGTQTLCLKEMMTMMSHDEVVCSGAEIFFPSEYYSEGKNMMFNMLQI